MPHARSATADFTFPMQFGDSNHKRKSFCNCLKPNPRHTFKVVAFVTCNCTSKGKIIGMNFKLVKNTLLCNQFILNWSIDACVIVAELKKVFIGRDNDLSPASVKRVPCSISDNIIGLNEVYGDLNNWQFIQISSR